MENIKQVGTKNRTNFLRGTLIRPGFLGALGHSKCKKKETHKHGRSGGKLFLLTITSFFLHAEKCPPFKY